MKRELVASSMCIFQLILASLVKRRQLWFTPMVVVLEIS
jgi:hypothetical protein